MTRPAELFHVPLEGGTAAQIVEQARQATAPFWIVTANAEILLAAHEDSSYAAILRQASWRAVDGSGPQWALRFQGQDIDRVAGVDLAEALLQEAAKQRWRVAFFGGNQDVSTRTQQFWKQRVSVLESRAWPAGMIDVNGTEDLATSTARKQMEAWQPRLILVALGGGQKQERWIARHVSQWSFPCTVVGVGGAFDMWSGRLRRAPRWMRGLGIEWLWRLGLEPSRWRRIYRAIAVFPCRALLFKLKEKGFKVAPK